MKYHQYSSSTLIRPNPSVMDKWPYKRGQIRSILLYLIASEIWPFKRVAFSDKLHNIKVIHLTTEENPTHTQNFSHDSQ